MTEILKLGALNCVWVVIITVNSRIVNRPGASFLSATLTQCVVSIAYFTLVRQIQKAEGFRMKAAFVLGGALGGGIGVWLTSWAH